jgi:hypothetical protein
MKQVEQTQTCSAATGRDVHLGQPTHFQQLAKVDFVCHALDLVFANHDGNRSHRFDAGVPSRPSLHRGIPV